MLVDCNGLGLSIDPSVTTVSSRPLWGKKMKSLDASQSRNFLGAQKQMLSYSKISYSRYHQPQTVNGRDSLKMLVMLAAPLSFEFWLLSRSCAPIRGNHWSFSAVIFGGILGVTRESGSRLFLWTAICTMHTNGSQTWCSLLTHHIWGSYGCCLDFSISALCSTHLLQFAPPSLSQLSSQLPQELLAVA